MNQVGREESESQAREKGLLQQLTWQSSVGLWTMPAAVSCLRRGHQNSGHSEAWQRRVRKGHSDNLSSVMGDELRHGPGCSAVPNHSDRASSSTHRQF